MKILCIDTETTGFIAGHHDLIEVGAVILEDFKIVDEFERLLCPIRPENADPKALAVNKLDLDDLAQHGYDQVAAREDFIDWVKPHGRPSTLAHNWGFDRTFIEEWLGPKYQEYKYRLYHWYNQDTMNIGHFLNHQAIMRGEKVPFQNIKLQTMAAALGIENPKAHSALSDAKTTAAVYIELLKTGGINVDIPQTEAQELEPIKKSDAWKVEAEKKRRVWPMVHLSAIKGGNASALAVWIHFDNDKHISVPYSVMASACHAKIGDIAPEHIHQGDKLESVEVALWFAEKNDLVLYALTENEKSDED